jgi:hypothetical protein
MVLADPEILVQRLIKDALTGQDVTVGTLIPYTMPDPFVLVRSIPGQESGNSGLFARALVDVQVWVGGTNAKTASRDLAVSISTILFQAWRNHVVIPGVGYIAGVLSATDPALLMDGTEAHGTFRYQVQFSFSVRPV